MNDQPTKSMRESVLQVIETGSVKMRPKWEFVLRGALLLAGVLLVALTTLYLASFIVFTLRATGVWFAPGFGAQGWGPFFSSLPWMLLVITVIFIILLEVLIKRYAFAYANPFLYTTLAIIVLVVAGGILLGYTPLHQQVFNRFEQGGFPFGQLNGPSSGITAGKVLTVTVNGYQIQDPRGQTYLVVINKQTQMPLEKITVGDLIVVLGQPQNKVIQAVGIQKHNDLPPPPDFKKDDLNLQPQN